MDEEGFERVEARLGEWFVRLGFPELNDNAPYVEVSAEGGPPTIASARNRILGKLAALDRLLSLYDRATFASSMEKLRAVLGGMPPVADRPSRLPDQAVLVLDGHVRGIGDQVYFAEMPSLSEKRAELHRLREWISGA